MRAKGRISTVLAAMAVACAPPAPAVPQTASNDVRVGLTEWDVIASATAVSAGQLRLTVTNAGTTAHDLRVAGATRGGTRLLAPGESQKVTLDVAVSGTLQLWCDVAGHRDQGMTLELPVVAEGAIRRGANRNYYGL